VKLRDIWHVVNTFDGWPEGLEDHPIQDAISHLYDEREWKDNQTGLRELTRTYSGWLRLSALVQEQHARRVPVGHPDRNKKHEPCGACGRIRRDCGCEQDEMMALVEQLTAPADAPTG